MCPCGFGVVNQVWVPWFTLLVPRVSSNPYDGLLCTFWNMPCVILVVGVWWYILFNVLVIDSQGCMMTMNLITRKNICKMVNDIQYLCANCLMSLTDTFILLSNNFHSLSDMCVSLFKLQQHLSVGNYTTIHVGQLPTMAGICEHFDVFKVNITSKFFIQCSGTRVLCLVVNSSFVHIP